MINIRQIKYFIAVAETLHIGKAAEILNISQPPLNRQISLLEQDLGAELFIRHPRGVALTAAGQQFLLDSKSVISSLEQACRNVRQVAQGNAGALSIGFMMHAVYNIVPALTKRFVNQHPGIKLNLQEIVPGELTEQVQKGSIDAGIMFEPPVRRGLGVIRLEKEPLCVALPVGHPLTSKKTVLAKDLEHESFIGTPYKVAPTLRKTIEDYCTDAGFAPKFLLETQLQQTIVSLVARGLGIAMVPVAMMKANLPDVIYRTLFNAPLIKYVIIWRKDNINPALENFLNISKEFNVK